MAETLLETSFGPVQLHRLHTPPDSPLRAWSAADELLLDQVGTEDPGQLLIVNDAWGALSVALARWKPVVWSDSALARAAIDANLEHNQLPLLAERAVAGDRLPPGRFETVLMAAPKSAAVLDWHCQGIGACIEPEGLVLVGGMTRHLPRSVADTLERRLGPVTWHRAMRKARVLEVRVAGDAATASPPALEPSLAFTTDEGIAVLETPGVFSAGHLDVGTALLLDELARRVPSLGTGRVADLGSGNGVIGATLGRRWPDVDVDLLDVSDLAGAAAAATWRANHGDDERGNVIVADGFPEGAGPYDLIVTNPPFHQGHAEDRGLTQRLLGGAAQHLQPDGSLVVVTQRHRELHHTLRRWFAQVDVISAHRTHVVLVATQPKRTGG